MAKGGSQKSGDKLTAFGRRREPMSRRPLLPLHSFALKALKDTGLSEPTLIAWALYGLIILLHSHYCCEHAHHDSRMYTGDLV